jgi:hypothetical protein
MYTKDYMRTNKDIKIYLHYSWENNEITVKHLLYKVPL